MYAPFDVRVNNVFNSENDLNDLSWSDGLSNIDMFNIEHDIINK